MLSRVLLFALLVYVGVKGFSLVRRLLASSSRPREAVASRDQGTTTSDMARDPVCGVFVPIHGSLSAFSRDGVVYFCSEECRRKFVSEKG